MGRLTSRVSRATVPDAHITTSAAAITVLGSLLTRCMRSKPELLHGGRNSAAPCHSPLRRRIAGPGLARSAAGPPRSSVRPVAILHCRGCRAAERRSCSSGSSPSRSRAGRVIVGSNLVGHRVSDIWRLYAMIAVKIRVRKETGTEPGRRRARFCAPAFCARPRQSG